MPIKIETFSNAKGGSSFFKALGHPLTVDKATALMAKLGRGPVAVYDPLGMLEGFAEFHDLSELDIRGVFVQRLEDLGRTVLGHETQPVTGLRDAQVTTLFVVAFDAKRLIAQMRHLLLPGAEILSLDEVRIPDAMLTNRRRYLDPLNFATNFALLRDAQGRHTRIVTADYWSGWGAPQPPSVWFCLFDQAGKVLAQWQEQIHAPGASLVVDSRQVRQRFSLGEYTGSLFIHVMGVAGHDVVKYALDTYGDDPGELSCTHDANAWPSDLYAGLPAPKADESVVLWIQNSHPVTIPKRGIGVNLMGTRDIAWLDAEIPPFASHPLDVATLLPQARWPQQIEVQAGRYFVRPRYEVQVKNGRSRIAHANVERNDLAADPVIPKLGALMGKGFILPAPILPTRQWDSVLQPTPMSTAQQDLPIMALLYDASGVEVARHALGCLPRNTATEFDLGRFLRERELSLPSGYGHVELVYEFSQGGSADGWLHSLFRYTQKASGHVAETSFGGHIFNTVLTYKNEPQSYASAPPGLSTRLFLRLADEPLDTFCHLIYSASTPWHAMSTTSLSLYDAQGSEVAVRQVRIPCGGSLLWRYAETFDADARRRAGANAYILIRDATCRLFGYHGALNGDTAFSLDHMFGF
ncbi:MAG: hypothetical protein ACM3KD_11375 [Hyphomicrobiaceae bacterium]